MFQVAQIIGDLLRETIRTREQTGLNAETTFNATLIVGGQIKGMEPRLFMIYPEGNFIEASEDTPFFQIGETKYGRPILVRGFQSDMSFESAVKLLMVSFDSTMAANLSVALPLDMLLLPKDRFQPLQKRRITEDDPYFSTISSKWSDALRTAFHSLPDYVID
jgi:putative proteasome-type protease